MTFHAAPGAAPRDALRLPDEPNNDRGIPVPVQKAEPMSPPISLRDSQCEGIPCDSKSQRESHRKTHWQTRSLGRTGPKDFRCFPWRSRKWPYPPPVASLMFPKSARLTLAIARSVRIVSPGRTQETSSPTSPLHLVRKARARDQILESQYAKASRAHATSLRTVAPANVRTPHARRSKCRSRRPCRIAPRSGSSSRTQNRKGKAACTAKMESARVSRSPLQFSAAVRSQSLLLSIGPILRRADEHLDKIVMQSVVKLALKTPFELRIVEIPRMQVEVISVDRNALILELDDDLNSVAFRARGER